MLTCRNYFIGLIILQIISEVVIFVYIKRCHYISSPPLQVSFHVNCQEILALVTEEGSCAPKMFQMDF